MPPKRKRTKKKINPMHAHGTSETDENDFFEDECNLRMRLRNATKSVKIEPTSAQTKSISAVKASSTLNSSHKKPISSSMQDETSKHVDNNSNTNMGQINQGGGSNGSDVDSDIELDMLPKRKHNQLSVVDDDDNEDDVIPPKRKKVATDIVDLSELSDDVESPSFSPTKSVKKSTKAVNEKTDENASGKLNDGNASAEEEILESEHISDSEIDVEITKRNKNECGNDTDKDDDVEHQSESEAGMDDAQVENCLDDEEHENGDDDILSLCAETDDLFDLDESTPSSAPPKEKTKPMDIPRWKRVTIDLERSVQKEKPNDTVASSSECQSNERENTVFRKPDQPVAKKNLVMTVNRDPRTKARSVMLGNAPTIQNNIVAPLQAKPPNCSNVKSRLGWNNKNGKNNGSNFSKPNASIPSVTQNRVFTITKSTIDEIPKIVGASPVAQKVDQRVSTALTQNTPIVALASTSLPDSTLKPFGSTPKAAVPLVAEQRPTAESKPEKPPVSLHSSAVSLQSAQKTQTKAQPIGISEPYQQATFSLPSFAALTSKTAVQLIYPSFATGPQQYEPAFTYLFKRVCRLHMHDACANQSECRMEHIFPDHKWFRKSLDKMFQKNVIDLYDNYMRRNQKLFDFYFDVFCDFFADNKLCDKLTQMVNDCNERKVQFHFARIVDGLIKTGHTYVRALGILITSISTRKIGSSRELVKLILSPRNDNVRAFVSVLESIANTEHFKFRPEWINTLLLLHNEKNVVELAKLICKIVSEKNIVTSVNEELLTKFNELYSKSK